ncbi:hypothetical protein OC523_007745 [Vibrio vulnificus]|uniref:hypothetical protein n=1 Tax=Vibrio navarrensis TaxID=29495 RepID=UPI00052C3686|nr:hypothetical protein [Vibrio navarrensis]EIV8469739.1 hypothetical protein [Vibrio vulnificus]KGK21505.1 hypothetical protein DC58_16345 [Vibrio navarrensis]MCU8461504.1 hypothetical protein [Vibrio vulnificus]
MGNERRKCLVKMNSYDDPEEGYFEQYGTQEKFDDANQPYTITVAIVELSSGRVVMVEPTQVKFI